MRICDNVRTYANYAYFFKKNSRDRKIFPLALINYITLSGGGFVRETGVKLKNLTMKELIESVG